MPTLYRCVALGSSHFRTSIGPTYVTRVQKGTPRIERPLCSDRTIWSTFHSAVIARFNLFALPIADHIRRNKRPGINMPHALQNNRSWACAYYAKLALFVRRILLQTRGSEMRR